MLNRNTAYKTTLYGQSYLFIAETALILLMLIVKLGFFYKYIGIGSFSAVMCAATVFMVMSVYLIVMRTAVFNPATFLKIIYTIICLFLFADRVYFSYLNKLPSFSAAKMMHQLPDIWDMVMQLVTFDHAVYILDLPLLLIFDVNFKKRTYDRMITKNTSVHLQKNALRFTAVLIIACLIFIGAAALRVDFNLSYLKNEIITYHTYDALKLIMGNASARNIEVSKYMQSVSKPVSAYYGIGAGRNVITIQVEALQDFVIGLEYNGQEITPNLNRLIAGESLYFENYYYQIGGGNTADAEFMVNNSLYPPEDEAAYVKYNDGIDFYGLPYILKDNGYGGAYAFHGYKGEFWNREKAYPNQGFDDYISEEDFELTETFNMGLSDVSFFSQTMAHLKSYKQPFYAFLITLSSHFPYVIPQEYRELDLLPEDTNTLTGDYLQAMRYLDSALGLFIDGLKQAGIYDNSVISVYGDHYAIPSSDPASYRMMSGLLGHDYYEEDIFKVPFIINIPGSGVNETIQTIGGHIDNLPTMLHILGIENTGGIMFGNNLISAECGIVYQQTHMARGSFISDDVILYYPGNGIMKYAAAINRKTGENTGVDGYGDIISDAKKTFDECDALISTNKVVIK
ncbi:MAG: LTA synthase family protein [Eubacteriales bacterium]|nr:LTA synthase family protein [Eubacteriales bacterium]